MNILPLPPDPHYDLGRASELVSAVTPARRSPETAGQRDQAARESTAQVLDVMQREALMDRYAETLHTRPGRFQPYHAQRALDAYQGVATQDSRELLVELLGISEYA